jgi:hypothetical protein
VIANTIFSPFASAGSHSDFCVAPEARDHLGADRGGDDDQQERTSLRREFLAHDRELGDAAAATAPLLRQVDREKAMFGDRAPELVTLASTPRTLREVAVTELRADARNRFTEHPVFF